MRERISMSPADPNLPYWPVTRKCRQSLKIEPKGDANVTRSRKDTGTHVDAPFFWGES
jgi:kynurenine formamidase